MASSRRRNTTRSRRRAVPRRNRNRRALFSKLQHVASNAPLRCNMPKDPPALNSTLTSSHIIPIRVIAAGNTKLDPPTLGDTGQLSLAIAPATAGKITAFSFTTAHLHDLVCGRFGFDKAVNAEYALLKVQYWGPTATQLAGKEIRPTLSVDTQTISGGISITDTGTEINRATLGVSIPVMFWYDKGAASKLFTVAPDQSNQWASATPTEFGALYVTVSRKAYKSLA